ncbi:MAG TPA: carbon monoxide dehydrogenase subunit G [Rugosimonospora sp.]|nr:carbon monoxide dehydrogenase subunit G [Rugosimonospora sp.]
MKVSGEATLSAPVAEVYRVLHDPGVLVRTIPGCQQLDLVGADAYRMTVHAGVAAIKGTFSGDVRLLDVEAPHAFVLQASGSGTPGTVSTRVQVRLAEGGGGTLLRYEADADVGGPIGGVGQRLLASVAHRTAHEFFTAVNSVLAEPLAEPSAEPAPAAGPGGAGPSGAGAAPGVPAAGPVVTSWRAPASAEVGAGSRSFLAGAALGAGIALLGALVGGFVASRAARRR